MKKVLAMVSALSVLGFSAVTLASTPAFVLPSCLQDQYGNQYTNLVQDSTHDIVTGTVINNDSYCVGIPWSMIGSWTVNSSGKVILELSVANNGNPSQCVPIYKLKGPYPQSSWSYADGFDDQNFKYATCSASSPVVSDAGPLGTHYVKPE
jgi:hypothetical protein